MTDTPSLISKARKHRMWFPPDLTRKSIEKFAEGFVVGIGLAFFGALMFYAVFGVPA
jgi:hypothetical protein